MKKIEWIRPREIARRGLIKSTGPAESDEGHYRFIMREINAGRLRAKNRSKTDYRAYWLVSNNAIDAYNRKRGL